MAPFPFCESHEGTVGRKLVSSPRVLFPFAIVDFGRRSGGQLLFDVRARLSVLGTLFLQDEDHLPVCVGDAKFGTLESILAVLRFLGATLSAADC